MIVSHNIQSMNINRITNDNISLHGKSTEKVSSGYRINRAADDPAGLGISEVLRRQIRGLMQATNNTKDGVAFVQTADGAMEGVHSILQRMNELTVKALQGTYSEGDRMAINVEFDQLRTEIDRINGTTDFGTGIPVFEEHEPSYYQICGNRKWDDNQLHTITSMANALKIHLPDGYEPKDYTIAVPPGTYTTQELVDEIDSALSNMVPPNPGFVFELTSDGYCNLSFEKADGTPTKIDFVDGSLSYLIYDFQGGMGSNDILGTTIFGVNERLVIVSGKNDELGFYLEGAAGASEIAIKIPAGSYTRGELIDIINVSLPTEYGVAAVPYGDHCIQITSGSDAAITGLHGNMFKYEDSSPIYTSIFYDNVKYGTCNKWPAVINGQYNELPIRISESNYSLKFNVNGTDVTVDIPYNTDEDYTEYGVWELAKLLNTHFGNNGIDAVANVYYTSSPDSYPYLSLSSTIKGENSSLVFDTSKSLYKNTYKTLFFSTSEYPENEPSSLASVIGIPDLSGVITLDENDSFDVVFTTEDYVSRFTISDLAGTYKTLETLVDKLNSRIPDSLKDKMEFTFSGSKLVIQARSSYIKSIDIDIDTEIDTHAKLFSGEKISLQGSFTPESGSKVTQTIQGTTTSHVTINSSTVMSSICSNPESITIDENSNTITFIITRSNGASITHTIKIDPSGTYNLLSLAEKINEQIGKNSTDQYLRNISAEMYGDCLRFIFKPTEIMSDGTWTINISYDSKKDALNNSIWKNFFESESNPDTNAYPTEPATLTTMTIPMGTGIVVDDTNCALKLELQIDAGTSYEADLNILQDPPKTYNNIYDLRDDLRNAIKGTALDGMVNVDVVGGRLQFTADIGTFAASGSFYDEIMCRGMCSNYSSYIGKGICNYDPAFVIGRQDLTTEPIEITGSNNEFIFDVTHDGVKQKIRVEIPEGVYNVNKIDDKIEDKLKELIQDEFIKGGLGDFEVDVRIGGHDLGLENTNDSTVLQITLNRAPGKEPDDGSYIIDGIRGSAATTVFYKSTSAPRMTYIVGTKDIREGISFEPGKNVLTLSANSVPYQYTFDKPHYTVDEFLDALNSMFAKGDDNGNPAPLRASIDKNGALKISYTVAGANAITDIGGSGRSTIFFEEEGRDSRDPLLIQVGSEVNQTIEIPRISVSSAALGINSITISKQKYAEKANVRIKEAIKLLSAKRSTYGAMQNRLEHTINSNNNVIDRVQASESLIRDADLSSEMTRYTNLSILLRMGSAMIAESNQRIEKLMTILQ